MPVLKTFQSTETWKDIPKNGLFIVLTRSQSFLAKTIQGFQRLFQWTSGEHHTELSPNHADMVKDGYAIGALKFGIDGNDFEDHYSDDKNPYYYIIKPILTKRQNAKAWGFVKAQVHEGYAYFDILIKYPIMSLIHKWFGGKKPLDRKRWTCFSLIASALNYAWGEEVFPDPYKISPIEFVDIVDSLTGVKFK